MKLDVHDVSFHIICELEVINEKIKDEDKEYLLWSDGIKEECFIE